MNTFDSLCRTKLIDNKTDIIRYLWRKTALQFIFLQTTKLSIRRLSIKSSPTAKRQESHLLGF